MSRDDVLITFLSANYIESNNAIAEKLQHLNELQHFSVKRAAFVIINLLFLLMD